MHTILFLILGQLTDIFTTKYYEVPFWFDPKSNWSGLIDWALLACVLDFGLKSVKSRSKVGPKSIIVTGRASEHRLLNFALISDIWRANLPMAFQYRKFASLLSSYKWRGATSAGELS